MENEKIIKSKNKNLLLQIAIYINKQLYEEEKITYQVYKITEENLLKKLSRS